MAHTFCEQILHIVFCTKNLHPFLSQDKLDSLFAYLSGTIKNLNGWLISRSGSPDHIHLLVNTPTNCSLSELMCKMKSASSSWSKKNIHHDFSWSDGYSAFSVSVSSIDKIKLYFENETKNHSINGYQDEIKKFLEFQGVKYKPEFITKTTYTRLYYHLVWAVKERENYLNHAVKNALHSCIELLSNDMKIKLLAIENVADHIHLLIDCPQIIATAEIIQRYKTTTTHLLNGLRTANQTRFCWQEGFGIFSVGKQGLDNVINYIQEQENHHRVHSFAQEWALMTPSLRPCRG